MSKPNASIPISQSPKHVSISMDAPDPSLPHSQNARETFTKIAEQSDNLTTGPTVSKPARGQTIEQTPAASAAHVVRDAVISGANPSGTANPNVGVPRELTQYNEFWNAYNDLADKEDKEIVKGYGSDLDTLLIFAGLFSATNTAFIIESYKDLKEDQAETTNKLLRSLILTIHQSSSFTESFLHESHFGATKRSTSTNIFFFTSLFCSLFAAFGAVIGKQWLNHYEKEGQLKSPAERGLERHRKYLGLEQWRFQAVVETLPTLLQISLLSFLAGLVQFLWLLNLPVAIVAFIFTVITSGFWFICIGIGVSYPGSPFQTRLSVILQARWPFKFLNTETRVRDATQDEIIRGRCVDWLMKRSTTPATLSIVAKAMAMLANNTKSAVNPDRIGVVVGYLVQSRLEIDRVRLGVSSEMLQSSLVALRDITRNWDTSKDLVHPEDTENSLFIRTLWREIWDLLLSNGENQGAMLKEAGLQILRQLYAGVEPDSNELLPNRLENWEARCLFWSKKYGEESEKVWAVSKSILQGLTRDRDVPKFGRPLGLLLHSVVQSDGVSLNIPDKSLRVLMPILRVLISSWDRAHDLVHEEDHSNHSFLNALNTKLWYMVLNPSFQNDESTSTIFEILEAEILDWVTHEDGLQSTIKALNEHLALNSIGPIHKLRCFSIIYRKLRTMGQIPKDYVAHHAIVHQLLISTAWGPNKEPEYQYADVRMGWIVDDFDAIHQGIKYRYAQYLSELPWSSFQASLQTTLLYIRSLHRLLTQEPREVWFTGPESGHHIKHLKNIINKEDYDITIRLRCLVCFFLLFELIEDPWKSINAAHYPQRFKNLTKEWVWIVERSFFVTNVPGLFDYMITVADSPTEGLRIASGFWHFLIIARRLDRLGGPGGQPWRIPADRVRLERDQIVAYLMDKPIVMNADGLEDDELGLRDLPKHLWIGNNSPNDDITRSSFILSIPNIDPDIRLLAADMFNRAMSKLQLPDNLEMILRAIGNIILGGPSDILLEVMEEDNHVETIANLIGEVATADGVVQQPRRVQWWCLRLFLLMWYRRSSVKPFPYTTKHCAQKLGQFFSSMENRFELDVIESQQGINEVPLAKFTALQLMDSACSYFEFVSAEWSHSLPIAVASGYQETCGHFVISGASRSETYQGDDGPDRWKQDIMPLIERMGALSRLEWALAL